MPLKSPRSSKQIELTLYFVRSVSRVEVDSGFFSVVDVVPGLSASDMMTSTQDGGKVLALRVRVGRGAKTGN